MSHYYRAQFFVDTGEMSRERKGDTGKVVSRGSRLHSPGNIVGLGKTIITMLLVMKILIMAVRMPIMTVRMRISMTMTLSRRIMTEMMRLIRRMT